MKSLALLSCVVFLLSVDVCSASEPNALHDKILHDTTIQGFVCARGEAWFYPDGALNQCTLARPSAVGDLRVPRGAVVEFWPNGTAHYLMVPRATVLAGYHVRGGSHLGLSRGATTTFYRTGELRSIYLVSSQRIQGVPCRGGGWNTFSDPLGGENDVEFYRDGKLRSCRLTRDYLAFRSGQRVVLPHLAATAAINRFGAAQ